MTEIQLFPRLRPFIIMSAPLTETLVLYTRELEPFIDMRVKYEDVFDD
jgi:hypothetical protein